MSVSIFDALKEVVLAIRDWADENKVQKVDGKDLSTNDYTTEEKNKVASIPNDLIILNGDLYLAHDGEILKNSAVALPSGGDGSSSSSVSNLSTIIHIPASDWFEVTTNALYSQYVTINEVTENTKVWLNPTTAQIASLQSSETILTIENDSGTVKVWAIGGKPTTDFDMQVTLTEVAIV